MLRFRQVGGRLRHPRSTSGVSPLFAISRPATGAPPLAFPWLSHFERRDSPAGDRFERFLGRAPAVGCERRPVPRADFDMERLHFVRRGCFASIAAITVPMVRPRNGCTDEARQARSIGCSCGSPGAVFPRRFGAATRVCPLASRHLPKDVRSDRHSRRDRTGPPGAGTEEGRSA